MLRAKKVKHMKTNAPRPFYGNQHITPERRNAALRVAERRAVSGPTNRQVYLGRIASGDPVPPSTLLTELGESDATQKQGTAAVHVRNDAPHSEEVGEAHQEHQSVTGDGAPGSSET